MNDTVGRYDVGTPVRGRRHSLPGGGGGGGLGWLAGGGGGSDSRSRSRRRSVGCGGQKQQPLWFAGGASDAAPPKKPTADERFAFEKHPVQRKSHPESSYVAPSGRKMQPHLIGTEKEWFPTAPAPPSSDLSVSIERASHRRALDEQQYNLHKAFDEKRRSGSGRRGKGIVAHRAVEEAAHHFTNHWFGEIPRSRSGSCGSSRPRPRLADVTNSSPAATGRKQNHAGTTHQQQKLEALRVMQVEDRRLALRGHRKLFQQHAALATHGDTVIPQNPQHPQPLPPHEVDPPFGTARDVLPLGVWRSPSSSRHTSPAPSFCARRSSSIGRSVHRQQYQHQSYEDWCNLSRGGAENSSCRVRQMQQLGEALSSYRQRQQHQAAYRETDATQYPTF